MSVRLKQLVCAAALAGLAGCGATGLDLQPESVRLAERGIAKDRKIGVGFSVVRTYQEDDAGNRQEIGNAVCTLRSAQFSGRVMTPQQVNYTSLIQADRFENRGRPAPLTVTCRAGDRSATVQVPSVPAIPTDTGTHTFDPNSGISVSTRPLFGQLASSYPWVFPRAIGIVLR